MKDKKDQEKGELGSAGMSVIQDVTWSLQCQIRDAEYQEVAAAPRPALASVQGKTGTGKATDIRKWVARNSCSEHRGDTGGR